MSAYEQRLAAYRRASNVQLIVAIGVSLATAFLMGFTAALMLIPF
jgi:hypothetical protein